MLRYGREPRIPDGRLLSPVQVGSLDDASLTHFIVPIKPGSAISHGAVKLTVTDVEETRLVKSEFVLHGDQGSPPQRKPQSPLGTCVLSQNL